MYSQHINSLVVRLRVDGIVEIFGLRFWEGSMPFTFCILFLEQAIQAYNSMIYKMCHFILLKNNEHHSTDVPAMILQKKTQIEELHLNEFS